MATLAFLSGEEPAASKLDDLVSAFATATPAWTTTGTSPVIGNGTRVTRFKQVGRFCAYRIGFKMGSTTTFGGAGQQWSVGLPVTPLDPGVPFDSLNEDGRWVAYDASANVRYHGPLQRASGSTVFMLTSASGAATATMNNAAPFTWATGDYLMLRGWVEVAG